MKRLRDRRTRIRLVTDAEARHRPLVVELHPSTVTVRELGRRRGYEIPWGSVYMLGAQQSAARARAEKAQNGGRRAHR